MEPTRTKDTANKRNANLYGDRREHLENGRNNKIRRIDTELSRSEFGTDSFSEEDLDNESFSEGKGSSASLSQRNSSKRHQKYIRKLLHLRRGISIVNFLKFSV